MLEALFVFCFYEKEIYGKKTYYWVLFGKMTIFFCRPEIGMITLRSKVLKLLSPWITGNISSLSDEPGALKGIVKRFFST